jgi:hypothetical protein
MIDIHLISARIDAAKTYSIDEKIIGCDGKAYPCTCIYVDFYDV